MLSAIYFCLDQSKILSFGNGLSSPVFKHPEENDKYYGDTG